MDEYDWVGAGWQHDCSFIVSNWNAYSGIYLPLIRDCFIIQFSCTVNAMQNVLLHDSFRRPTTLCVNDLDTSMDIGLRHGTHSSGACCCIHRVDGCLCWSCLISGWQNFFLFQGDCGSFSYTHGRRWQPNVQRRRKGRTTSNKVPVKSLTPNELSWLNRKRNHACCIHAQMRNSDSITIHQVGLSILLSFIATPFTTSSP